MKFCALKVLPTLQTTGGAYLRGALLLYDQVALTVAARCLDSRVMTSLRFVIALYLFV